MPRYVHRIPGLKLHKPSGNAYVRLEGRMIYCGRYGSGEAQAKYERLIAEWIGRDRSPAPAGPAPDVAEVLGAFMRHALAYYRSPTGSPTGEAKNFADSIRPLRRLYQDLPAKDFTVQELKAVRGAMVASGLARKTINSRVNRIRRIWKWAAAEGMLPASAYVELQTLDALRKYRTEARETPRVLPVAEDRVRATLPHLPGPVAAMVEIQLLTGCRVGEVLAMTAAEIDRTVDPWEYRPGSHKNDYRDDGRARCIPLGPRARAILGPFLDRHPNAFLFDPRDAAAEALKASGSKRRPPRRVRTQYDRRSYGQAIYRGCDRTFPHPILSKVPRTRPKKLTPAQARELKAWRKAHRWSPLQLRHAAATRFRRQHGLEASQAMLGHARADVTQVYAERLDDLARDIARSAG